MAEQTKTYLRLQGRMTFSNHKDISAQLDQALLGLGTEIVLDMSGVDYIDSSALGMLLIARDKASRAGKVISIEGCKEAVANVFVIASFGRLFEIR